MSKVVVAILDTTTDPISPKVGVSVTYSKDGGSTHTTAAITNAKGVATNDLNLGTGSYTLYVDLVINSSYPDLTLIELTGDKIKGSDIDLTTVDGAFGSVTLSTSGDLITGTPSVGNNGQVQQGDGTSKSFRSVTAVTTHHQYNNPNGVVGSVQTTGTATSFNTSSDPRLKSEFRKPLRDEAIDKFMSLYETFGIFRFIGDDQKEVWGQNAHSCIDLLGDIGSEGIGSRLKKIGDIHKKEIKKDGVVTRKAEVVTPAGVDQGKNTPYLIAVVWELLKDNTSMKKRLDDAGI